MKKILVALATAVVLVSCGSAPEGESASLLEVGGAPAAEDAGVAPDESTSVVTESSSAPDAADISGAAIDTECSAADVLDDTQPILAEAEPVSLDEAVLTSSPAEITLVWDMSDAAAAVVAKSSTPAKESEGFDTPRLHTTGGATQPPVKEQSEAKGTKQPTTTKSDVPVIARTWTAQSGCPPVAQATGTEATSTDESEAPDTPSTGIIAMASPTRAGEKAIDLPILPPQLVPSTRPSPVFVMQYDPNDGVEKTSGLVAETAAPAIAGTPSEGSGSKEHGIVLKTGQYLDVTYPGAGWVYLGEDKDEDGGKKIIFKGRKLGEADTQFTLRAQRAGEAVLHFYKNDVATRTYVDDYMTVVVSEEAALATDKHVKETKTQIAEAKHTPQPVAVAKAEPKATPVIKGEATSTAKAEAPIKAAPTTVAKAEPAKVTPVKAAPVAEAKKTASPVAKAEPKTIPVPVAKAASVTKSDTPLLDRASAREVFPARSGATKQPPVTKVEPRDETPIKVTPAPVAKAAPVTKNAPALPSPFAAAPEASSPAATHASLAIPGDMNENALLQAARKAYNASRYSDCLTLLDAFFDKATKRFDEGLYLEGLALEAHSDAQNIKGAIDSYEILMKNWPASRLWNKARERSIYLKRMYIDIR